MNTNQSATAIQLQAMQATLAQCRLIHAPESQAEAIAEHYVRHAIIAQNVLQMLKDKRRLQCDTPEVNSCIAVQIQIIKDNHLNDFGIPLEWKEQP